MGAQVWSKQFIWIGVSSFQFVLLAFSASQITVTDRELQNQQLADKHLTNVRNFCIDQCSIKSRHFRHMRNSAYSVRNALFT